MGKVIIKKSILRIIAFLTITGLNWTGLLAVGNTLGAFNDIEDSAQNIFLAGSLDIFLDSAGIYISNPIYPTDTTAVSIIISNNGSLAAQYNSAIVPLTADTDPCDYVDLDATDGTQNYSGPLLDFISTASLLDNPANWSYTFTIDSLAPPSVWDKTCYFKWVFTAWDKDIVEPTGGFIDIDEKSGGIRIGKTIVLNEILADPLGYDTALKPNGEWVELYNNSNVDFDVNGWVIYDSDDLHELYITTANTNTGSTIVPAHGFLVVYRNGDSDFSINNSNETVRLYNDYPVSSSVLIDSFSWTSEKPEGFSFARIPDGVGAWIDPIPTPGEPNVLQEEIEEQTANEFLLLQTIVFDKCIAPEENPEPNNPEDNCQTETEEPIEEETVLTEPGQNPSDIETGEEVTPTEEIVPTEETTPTDEESVPAEEIVPEESVSEEDNTTTELPENIDEEIQTSAQEPVETQDIIESPEETQPVEDSAFENEVAALPSDDIMQDVIETVENNNSDGEDNNEEPNIPSEAITETADSGSAGSATE